MSNTKAIQLEHKADLAQLVERKALNLVVMGSSPMVDEYLYLTKMYNYVHLHESA